MLGLYHYIALGLFAAFAVADQAFSARRLPDVRHWRIKGIISTIVYFAAVTYAPLMWDAWLGENRLFAADTLPLWAQIAGGFLVLELFIYAWHRTMHNVPVLWRWFHQMHHSAERVDIWGAFYFSPLDMLGWAFLGSLALVLGFGISAEAAIVINVASTFMGMFQHTNIRTPRWVGYFIQRPESHNCHHERGVHARNYGDLPLFDMIFGTFHNPKSFDGQCGFYDGGSTRVGAMLMGRAIV